MKNTGRIKELLELSARKILFEDHLDSAINNDLIHMCRVDLAHILMLEKTGLIDSERAVKLIQTIDALREADFAPLRYRSAPRGLYLMYEDYISEILGPDVGGMLHIARSRNDLTATAQRLRLRTVFWEMALEALFLVKAIIDKGKANLGTVMPAYTHYQAAVPITFGHYLLGVATALERDIAWLMEGAEDIDKCTLGAGAVGGTSLPIDQTLTSKLLGFSSFSCNSVDSVASRDFVLRILGGASVLGTTLSRFAHDLLIWTTREFNFLSLPDRLVGSSSAMPQKKNPFIIEQVQGMISSVSGAFVSASMSMHAKPFSNAVAVGTESTAYIWSPIITMKNAIFLMRLIVNGASPNPESMLQKTVDGYTTATEFANRLCMNEGLSFRDAHRLVGEIVNKAIEMDHTSFEEAAGRVLKKPVSPASFKGLDPELVVSETRWGGGPAGQSSMACLESVRSVWLALLKKLNQKYRRWWRADRHLKAEMKLLINGKENLKVESHPPA